MKKQFFHISVLLFVLILSACSTTEGVPDGDQLYTGISKIEYTNYERNNHAIAVQQEIEAALAAAPNGALFGSSYYKTPFPISLWVWNAFHDSEDGIGKWANKTFGNPPVLMSGVNPVLRTTVAQSVLRNHGYFHGQADYNILPQSNPKKAKVGYSINMGHLFTLDSISYENFSPEADSLIHASLADAAIHKGDPFDVSTLDAERKRVGDLLRNNGYYYYQPDYASYLADTLFIPGKALMIFKLADNIPERARHKWYMGKIRLELRRQFMETLSDSISRRRFKVFFNGKRSPLRPRVVMSNMKLRPGQLFSYEKYLESNNAISSNGLFSMVDFNFTPRDSSAACDTLDLTLSCVFDKPYDAYIEGNFNGRTSGRMGPGLILGFTKRNAFRGGENLNINLKGSYEWQGGKNIAGGGDRIISYEYGADIGLEFPRLLLPFRWRHRFYSTPTTILKAGTNVLNRAGYFKRHVVSGELTYLFQTSANSVHQFSPLTVQYDYMSSRTDAFDSILFATPYLLVSMQDQFMTKMRYSYVYNSPATYRNPIFWQFTLTESGNILNLGYTLAGHKWNEKDKAMFKNPFAQFVKLETEFRKTWQVSANSQLVGHVMAGAVVPLGNSEYTPWIEAFYVGGANSIRAFTARSIGPGCNVPDLEDKEYQFIDHVGDYKFQVNLEYRPRLFGNLYGAVFLDAGNVWSKKHQYSDAEDVFKFNRFLKDLAVGTGVGIRYDMDFFVIRLDWGIGLHVPYKSGFYNMEKFKDSQSLHLAIGYPF